MSALVLAEKLFPEIKTVFGKKEIEHGLVHRIDNETSGLVLVATDQTFYDAMMQFQSEGKFEKWYRAKVQFVPSIFEELDGFPKSEVLTDSKRICLKTHFRHFGEKNREVRPVTENSGKAALKKCGKKIYETEIDFDAEKMLAVCKIKNGFRHQVRTHLALCGIPVRGDKLYNPHCDDGEDLCFEAFRLKFPKMDGKGDFVFEI